MAHRYSAAAGFCWFLFLIIVDMPASELLCCSRQSLGSTARKVAGMDTVNEPRLGLPPLSLHVRTLDESPVVCLAANKSGRPFYH